MISSDPAIWVSALLSLFVFSYLIKETVLYHIAENTLVTTTLAHSIVTGVVVIMTVAVYPILRGNFVNIIPLFLGLMLITRLSKKYAWLSKYGTAYLVGVGNGVIIRSVIQSDIIKQIQATSFSLLTDPLKLFNNLILSSSVIVTILYFIFTIPKYHEMKAAKYINKWARWVMIVGFSFSFASVMVSRISGATRFLNLVLVDWLGIYFG